jgi:hypothetical protein
MVYIIQLGLGAFMSSQSVKGHTKSWESHERDPQLGETDSIVIGNNQRLQKERNAIINTVSAMRPDFVKIFEKVRIS